MKNYLEDFFEPWSLKYKIPKLDFGKFGLRDVLLEESFGQYRMSGVYIDQGVKRENFNPFLKNKPYDVKQNDTGEWFKCTLVKVLNIDVNSGMLELVVDDPILYQEDDSNPYFSEPYSPPAIIREGTVEWTDKKDINGNEIAFGDVLKWESGITGSVFWNDRKCCMSIKTDKVTDVQKGELERSEIIGHV